jgi:succinate dehydrogenase cytochrome b subunit
MKMHNKRPVNLDLTTMRFPIPAIASILHRVSGVILFLLLPLLLVAAEWSLRSPMDFAELRLWMASPLFKLLFWGMLAAFIYHLLAGLRHILMDMGFGESLSCGRLSAKVVIGLSVVFILMAGAWLWLAI